jgi:hypothetical protein
MKVYLAASLSRQKEMRQIEKRLRAIGIECTSRWLREDQSIHTEGAREEFLTRCAVTDIQDVSRCETLVRFSDADELKFPLVYAKLATGARHFEDGLAWALGKNRIVVGGRQNIFDWLDDTTHLPDTEALISYFSSKELSCSE